jgi:hypothetical protein
MALQLKISLCFADKCKTLKVYDTTGLYSTDNTGGWGTPNITLASVTSATLDITPPNTSTPTSFDVTTTVNTATIVDGSFLLNIITDSNLTAGSFVDGIYNLTYTVTDGQSTYTTSIKTFSTCNTDCCVEKMKAKFKEKMCDCDWLQYWENYKKAEALLYGAKSAFACGKDSQAMDLLNQVNKICQLQKCCC